MRDAKLRVGLLCTGMELDAWALRMVALIQGGGVAEIVAVVRAPHTAAGAANGGALGAVLRRIEHSLAGKPGILPDAFRKVDAASALSGIECIDVADIVALRTFDLDVLVSVGGVAASAEIRDVPRHGVWTVERDEPDAAPPGYREVLESQPVTETSVRILASSRRPECIAYRSFASTKGASFADNRSNSYWKALHFIPRLLAELQRDGADVFFARVESTPAVRPAGGDAATGFPRTGERLGLVWRKFRGRLRSKFDDRRWFRQWLLLFHIGDSMATDLARFRPMLPPPDRFWADPFIVAREGKYFIFFEELPYATNRGHISVIEMDRDGAYGESRRVLERPYHLSYPFMFEFGGELYMIPDSGQQQTVELYRCTGFPLRWEFVKNIFEGRKVVDTTLFEHGGKWWMFANLVDTAGASTWDELHLFFADSPLAREWTAHPRNPVVSDVRSSRPAGRVFVNEGRIWRPSQDSSHHYGYGLNLCEVTELSETAYAERVHTRFKPDWNPAIVSTHTFNYEDGLTIVDAQMRRRR